MENLLSKWNLSHLKDPFEKEHITLDILRISDISDLKPILKTISIGDRIKFKKKFDEFKNFEDLEVPVQFGNSDTIAQCKEKIEANKNSFSITTEEAINLYVKLSFTYPALDEAPLVKMDFVNDTLREVILVPVNHNEFYEVLKSPPKGILLYGPPGSGKTRVIQNFKNSFKYTFFTVTTGTFSTTNDSAIDANTLFQLAKVLQPTVIYFEEAHGTFGRQTSKFKTQIKMEMDKITREDKVFFIAATNSMDTFDESFAKRFPKKIYLDLPGSNERLELLTHFTSNFKRENLDLNAIVKKTKNYTNSDLEFVCSNAYMIATNLYLFEKEDAIESKRPENVIVTQAHILTAIQQFKPTMTVQALELHKKNYFIILIQIVLTI